MRKTKYIVKHTAQFKKDYKRARKRGMDMALLEDVVAALAMGEALPERNQDHPLSGNWAGHRECHILPDWRTTSWCSPWPARAPTAGFSGAEARGAGWFWFPGDFRLLRSRDRGSHLPVRSATGNRHWRLSPSKPPQPLRKVRLRRTKSTKHFTHSSLCSS